MQTVKCFIQNVHFIDAFICAFVASLINAFYPGVMKKIFYLKLLGNYYHGSARENKVVIKHIYGENFSITEYKNSAIQWKGAYKRESRGLLTGTYDYNYNKESNKADWGKRYLRLLPTGNTISVLIEPILPVGNKIAISWQR